MNIHSVLWLFLCWETLAAVQEWCTTHKALQKMDSRQILLDMEVCTSTKALSFLTFMLIDRLQTNSIPWTSSTSTNKIHTRASSSYPPPALPYSGPHQSHSSGRPYSSGPPRMDRGSTRIHRCSGSFCAVSRVFFLIDSIKESTKHTLPCSGPISWTHSRQQGYHWLA